MEVAVPVEIEGLDDREAGPRAVGLRDRDRAVELDDRGVGHPGELTVERRDLGPVSGFVGMQRRDRGLHEVRATAEQGEPTIERRQSFGEAGRVPPRAVLVGEQHDAAVVEPRRASRVEQQHHREQPVHVGLIGHQLGEGTTQPDRFVGEIGTVTGPLALVEDEVDDGEHRDEPIGQQVVGRHPERDAGRA